MTDFPEYMLSMKKWLTGKSYFKETGKPFYLAIRFTDKDAFIIYDNDFEDDKVLYKVKGRTIQTRDPADIEPCVFIPIILFDTV